MRMLRSKTDPKTKEHTLCEPALSKCTWTCHKRHFARKFRGKMPDANPAASIMCEPALLKCTWTWHFVRKFTGKMADAPDTTSIEPQALTVTVTVRTPQCCHTVWGKKQISSSNIWNLAKKYVDLTQKHGDSKRKKWWIDQKKD